MLYLKVGDLTEMKCSSKNKKGYDLIEYGVMIAIVSIIAIVFWPEIEKVVGGLLTKINAALQAAGGGK